MHKVIQFGKKLGKEFKKDRATGLAAEQAYYYMLSIFPLLILLISIVPYLSLDPQKALTYLQSVMPSDSFSVIEDNVIDIITKPNGGLLTFGIIGTLWSASNGMQAFIRAMNDAFDVKESRSFIKSRLVSIGLTLGLLAAFIVAMVLPVFGKVILNFIGNFINISDGMQILINVLRWAIAFVIMVTVLAILYKVAPNKHFPFKQVLPGAIAATVMWQIISFGLSFYVSNFGNYSATYGSLGGVIVLMLWFFLTGLALVIGGEISALYHRNNTFKPGSGKNNDKKDPKVQSDGEAYRTLSIK
ncbi:MAG: YihY/virulence factor BrkB family protein [Bacillota bacterium]|uniref:YihY/virulence factor BrkB family protein n=1 Tax=Bacillaceae TaxID=186817 RepID=UPI0013D350D2|nr:MULTISPECIES: YihY/virulence factor BrkB family protein [Bacillaceae]MCC3645139.1 YihY/virulence factor BrkB family protein [Cytobacillus oceanisediminis]WHY35322.1 YihY/virulence factor BrkB family protein [Cytobacillus firmus]